MRHLRRTVGTAATGDANRVAETKRSKRLQLGVRSLALLFALTLVSMAPVVRQPRPVRVVFAGGRAQPIAASRSKAIVQAAPARLTLAPTKLLDGQLGIPYQQAFSTIGGVVPYTYTVGAGQLAPGLALNVQGVLSGAPTSAGVYSLAITATDALSNSISQLYELAILTPIAISPPALPDGKVGMVYRQRFGASGGTAPYTFTLALGALPPGLTLGTSGLFSGRPAADGLYEFTISATDVHGLVGSESYRLQIASALAIGPAVLPRGEVGAAYSQSLSASGGTAPYSFRVLQGVLPAGLTLSPDGTLGGTPTEASSNGFTVVVTDAQGLSGQQSYSLSIGQSALANDSHNLPAGSVGAAYDQSLSVAAGTGPYTFTLVSGLLPPGLSLGIGGRIEGTPSAEGFYSFEVAVTDTLGQTGNIAYGVVIAEAPLSLSPGGLPDSQVGTTYRRRVSASGGRPPYSFAVQGSLPPGIELRDNGQLIGRPTMSGSFSFGVGVTDRQGRIGGRLYNLSVAQPLPFSPLLLSVGQVGTGYQQALNVIGGAAPYTFALAEGALPPGINLSTAGTLSGRPLAPGVFSFTIGATDARDTFSSQSYSLRVLSPIAISPPGMPSSRVGRAYQQRLDASGGQAPYSFGIAGGALPPGLSLSADGVLSGTLAADGRYDFTVGVTDGRGIIGSRDYSLEVAQAIDISPALLEPGILNQAYSASLLPSGGTAPYTFDVVAGVLPPGLALSADGVLSGTPTLTGIYTATIGVTDTQQLFGSRQYAMSIAAPQVAMSPAALPNGQVGAEYLQQIDAGGGTAPYVFSSTALPPGLQLSPAGLLGGTPTSAGTFTFTVTALDAQGLQAARDFTLTIEPLAVVPVFR